MRSPKYFLWREPRSQATLAGFSSDPLGNNASDDAITLPQFDRVSRAEPCFQATGIAKLA